MSRNEASIGWVTPPEPIRGLDHLGVQAPCVALYSQLLPGITNVTDRARYYSFHPWLLWSFDKVYADRSLASFRRVLRRAECLFALVAIRHARLLGDRDEGRHGEGMVGRFELVRADPEADLRIDDYAGDDAPHRYFKNKLGGFGQYYFGPLRDLKIVDHAQGGPEQPPGYDRVRGALLAEAFDAGVPGKLFFEVLETSTVRWDQLDALARFCPCALHGNHAEHQLLLDLFLARTDAFRADGADDRRASLAVMLDLASRGALPVGTYEGVFRASAYSATLADGSAWGLDAAHVRARCGWGTYQRNELLSIALQALFASVLRAIERDRSGRIRRVADAADVAEGLLGSADLGLNRALEDVVSEVAHQLPPLGAWSHQEHEIQLGWELQQSSLDDDGLEAIAMLSVRVLLALLARGVPEQPYSDFELDPESFSREEIHLLSFGHAARSTWSGFTVGAWVRWLATHWCVGRHLTVALRKLRAQRRDTFRIRPLEEHLAVVEAPQPTFTAPRVARAVQILRDLGLLALDDEGNVEVTSAGRAELEACRGR